VSDYANIELMLRTERNRSADRERTHLNTLLHVARGLTRVTTAETSLLTSDGGTVDATHYQIDLATGDVLIGGLFGVIAALNDKDLLVPADIESYALDGSAAVALEDGEDGEVALVAIIVDGAIEIRAIFGAPAATGEAVAPTASECFDALRLAEIADYYSSGLGMVIARLLISYDTTVTMTHYAAATDLTLNAERLAGALG